MIVNWIIGFLIPWLLMTFAQIPHKLFLCLRVVPAASLIAFFSNDLFVRYGFWIAKPVTEANESFSTLPFNLGLYPVWGSILIQFIERRNWSPTIAIFIGSLGITFAEWGLVKSKWIVYGNGWNIGWTFVSYLAALTIVHLYVRALKRHVI